VLQPLCPIDAVPTPEGKVRSRKKPLPWLMNRVKTSRTRSLRKMSGQPSSSKSLKSQPMPETMAPDSFAATPASNATSANRPSLPLR
jgi:hypothetical protein